MGKEPQQLFRIWTHITGQQTPEKCSALLISARFHHIPGSNTVIKRWKRTVITEDVEKREPLQRCHLGIQMCEAFMQTWRHPKNEN